jgi:ferredoxin
MPVLTVEGAGTFEVSEGARLVNAIEDNGVDILHRCGGYARCTTCRVEFVAGEPDQITKAEAEKLQGNNLEGVRLACQISCSHAMTVRAISTMTSSGLSDPGPRPAATITPEPEWQAVERG